MSKKGLIGLLVFSTFLLVISVILSVSFGNYVATFQNYYSFMTFEKAIVWLVIFILLSIISLSADIYILIKLFKKLKVVPIS